MARIIFQPIGDYNQEVFKKINDWAEKEKYKKYIQDAIGSIVLFYKKGYIFAKATISKIDLNSKDNEGYPCRYYWEDLQFISINIKDFNEYIGYKESFSPQGFMRVREELTNEILSFIELYSENISIPEVFKNISEEDKRAFIKVRMGQSIFRKNLLNKQKSCCLCDINNEKLLIASHIKAWSECNQEEKVDFQNNGLLLCANHDKLFDKYLISFNKKGNIQISPTIEPKLYKDLNISSESRLKIDISEKMSEYLKHHNKKYNMYIT